MTGDLTPVEQDAVRLALRYLRIRAGSWAPIAVALRFDVDGIGRAVSGSRPVTASLAFRVARLAQVGIDDLLAGHYPPEGTCVGCGHPPVGGAATCPLARAL